MKRIRLSHRLRASERKIRDLASERKNWKA